MGSFQTPLGGVQSSALLETSCGYLLQELQMIWDEVGEEQFEREKVLLDIEQECLEVYRRKVDNANTSRARLHQELADSEAEFTHLLLLLGERSLPGRPEKMSGTLKEQLDSITPALREMRLRKDERVRQFRTVQGQIHKISAEIAGQPEFNDSSSNVKVNENDLSLKKLEEYQNELQRLQNEKIERLQKVDKYICTIQNLSAILGIDSSSIITKVHPSLNQLSGLSKNISNAILTKLDSTVVSLEAEKRTRLEKLHELGNALTNLWNLMDTPQKERLPFSYVTSLITVSSGEISSPGSLTPNTIQQAETEVKRLDQLKASKMKELFLKKQTELEEICKRSHMEIPSRPEMENITKLLNSGEIDHANLLKSMDEQISQAQEEASSRNAIMEKVEKWISARDEERWLEEYSRDENRYSVSRGAHKNLRRAERARLMVNKIPALVDSLITKTKSWEEERNKVFLYDEVPLLAMLEEYNLLRREKEEEIQRQRVSKNKQGQGQGQTVVGQENFYVPRPSTSNRRLSVLDRSINGDSNSSGSAGNLNRRLSLLGSKTINSPPHENIPSPIKEAKKERRRLIKPFSPSHDAASLVSAFSVPFSP
nr:65-kDa microtubule-associated protein 8 [Ipomoea batatas]GMD16550.1 65-kDa microtubule-associated protein 8 [Ipomoea batatas]GMD86098.1 65-kDa microtubule-associated protein 8 [Ipomoea batatas]GME09707.1 65-kDa microtubule-associated protein 8 [Ipomoea batatas]